MLLPGDKILPNTPAGDRQQGRAIAITACLWSSHRHLVGRCGKLDGGLRTLVWLNSYNPRVETKNRYHLFLPWFCYFTRLLLTFDFLFPLHIAAKGQNKMKQNSTGIQSVGLEENLLILKGSFNKVHPWLSYPQITYHIIPVFPFNLGKVHTAIVRFPSLFPLFILVLLKQKQKQNREVF